MTGSVKVTIAEAEVRPVSAGICAHARRARPLLLSACSGTRSGGPTIKNRGGRHRGSRGEEHPSTQENERPSDLAIRKCVSAFDRGRPPPSAGMNLERKKQIRRWYALIRPYEALTPEEKVVVDAGGAWPIDEVEHMPEHENLLDFLIDRGLDAWRRSNGGAL